MNLRSRCFPLEYYPGEILTEVEARRRRKSLIVYTLFLWSLWASNLEVYQDEECTEQEVKDYVQDIFQEIQPYL